MKKSWALAVLLGWSCHAQQVPPPAPQAPREVEQELERQLRGLVERREASLANVPPTEQPTGESISVYRLHHKVPKAARKSFERAQKKSQAGDHAAAASELETAVQLDPNFAGAYNDLGTQYVSLGRLGNAKTAFERASELDPDFWNPQYNLGLISMQQGDLAGAAQNARRALQHASEEAQVHWLLGYALCLNAATRAEGLPHVKYAARTIKEAKQFLNLLQAH
jgi:tetratricopeptide (TPR) repeat protein